MSPPSEVHKIRGHMAKKKVSRTRQSRLKDEPVIKAQPSADTLAIAASHIYAAKYIEHLSKYDPHGNITLEALMDGAIIEARKLLEKCGE